MSRKRLVIYALIALVPLAMGVGLAVWDIWRASTSVAGLP